MRAKTLLNFCPDYDPAPYDRRTWTKLRFALAMLRLHAFITPPLGPNVPKWCLRFPGWGIVSDCLTIEVYVRSIGCRIGRLGFSFEFPTGPAHDSEWQAKANRG